MKIVNDFSYINRKANQLEDLGVFHLRFDVKNEIDSLKIMDILEENFKVYQYKDNSNKRYEERELFFWSNKSITGVFTYFTISFNHKAISKNFNVIDKLLMLLIDKLSMLDFKVSVQYTNVISKEKIGNYLSNCMLDMNKIDLKLLSIIENETYTYNKNIINVEGKNKLKELSNFVKESLVGKRFKFNGIDGKLKQINDTEYGFFKLRAKTKYYPFELRNIKYIELN